LRYELSIERSAELLRQALPLMSRQVAALHPVSYALWFEYVMQANAPLRKAVDEHLAREGALDEFATHALFKRHVADVDPETAQRVVDEMQRLLGGIGEAASQTSTHAARFGASLARLAGALELGDTSRGMGDPAREISQARTLSSVVADVIADTGTMRSQLGGLAQRLGESRREIERLRDEVRRARDEALRDSLTGLANRRAFDQALAACLAGQSDTGTPYPYLPRDARAAGQAAPLATVPSASRAPADQDAGAAQADASTPGAGPWLLLSDIDDFQGINEAYGRVFGDQVLKVVAEALESLAPRGGTLARLEGDAFALLMPDLPPEAAHALAHRVRRHVGSARIRRHDKDERVTVAVGLASRRAGESAQAFVERADQALLAAKQAGADGLVLAD
jgi:diguanylate cyclase